MEQKLKEQRDLFAELYPECLKPKLHYGDHIPRSRRKRKQILSCFAPERRHKFSMTVARTAYNEATKIMIVKDLATFFTKVAGADACSEVFLRQPIKELRSVEGCFRWWGVA